MIDWWDSDGLRSSHRWWFEGWKGGKDGGKIVFHFYLLYTALSVGNFLAEMGKHLVAF